MQFCDLRENLKREAPLVALRKFQKKNLRMLTCVDRSTRPIHYTFCLQLVFVTRFHRASCRENSGCRSFHRNLLRYHTRMGNHAKRESVRCALWMIRCSHVSIVRLVQFTIPVSSDSQCHWTLLYHLPAELVSLSSVPMPSIDLNLWNRSRPSAFVPMSLGFTSVLTDDIVRSFRNTKS